jgi:hypothetical protein
LWNLKRFKLKVWKKRSRLKRHKIRTKMKILMKKHLLQNLLRTSVKNNQNSLTNLSPNPNKFWLLFKKSRDN